MRRAHEVVTAVTAVAAAVLLAAAVLSVRGRHRGASWTAFVRQWRTEENDPGKRRRGSRGSGTREGVLGAIGNTPLIRIRSLSDATGCQIYGKAEFLNPGGSVKDRVAAKIVQEALESGALRVGGVVTEGSAGSTAVSLAMVSLAYGCRCHVVLPDDAAIEKTQILEAMGATVERVRPVSITHKDHFVNVARRRALEARAADSAPEAQLYDLAKQDPQLEKKLDQHVKNHTSAVHDCEVVRSSPFEEPLTSSDFGASRPAAEEFVMSSEKEIVACVMAGATNGFDVKSSEGQVTADMEVFRVDTLSDSSGQGRGGYFADQSENLAEEFVMSSEKEILACVMAGATNGSDVKSSEGQVTADMEVLRVDTLSDSSGQGRGGYFADQFENLANFRAHYEGTGPEIWEQLGGRVDAFVAAAGTGGTIAGVSRYLKEQNPQVKCYIIDPPGSGLYNRVTRGVMYTKEEAEGKRMKNPFDTITEGIGINRITENFKQAQLDGAFRGTDREAVEMARYLMRNDGLFVGSSSAMNCVGAVRVAQMLGPGHTIVTILCDSGARHLSKFQNAAYLAAQGLTPAASSLEFL